MFSLLASPVMTGLGVLMTGRLSSRICGGAGRGACTVKGWALVEALSLPAASVARAATVCGPSSSGAGGKELQVPLEAAPTVPAWAPSNQSVTWTPTSAVPEIIGRAEPSIEPASGVRMTGGAGATESIVNGCG